MAARDQVGCRILCVTLLLLAGTSCATESVERSSAARYADPSDDIARLEGDLTQASDDNVDYLAAQGYQSAQEALNDAKERQAQGESAQDVLAKVAEGRASLDHARARAAIARVALKDVEAARAAALDADANDYDQEGLEQADQQLLAAARMIENGADTLSDDDSARMIEAYRNVENASLHSAYAGPSIVLVQEARNEGAERFAPKTLKRAETYVAAVEQELRAEPHDLDRAQKLADASKAEAQFLLQTTRKSRLITARNPEETALEMEAGATKLSQLDQELSELRKSLVSAPEPTATETDQQSGQVPPAAESTPTDSNS